MKTRPIVLAAVLLCVVVLGAEAAESIGSVISAKGSCWAVSQKGVSRKLALKAGIFLNDRIITKAGSSIQIMLKDDSVISQGEKSELVIDEYIYKEPVKKDNVKAGIKAIKGLFRMVTGKITSLNPERFKVKTRMATIGIRGCEVGFKLQAKREDIYILHLPPGRSILIERNAMAAEIVTDAKADMEDILTIVRQGVVVSIEEGGGLQKRDMTTQEILELMSSVFEITDAVDDSSEDKHQNDHAANLVPVEEEDGGGDGGRGKPYTSPPTAQLVANGGAPFTHWAWGLYEDGTVFYDGNALIPSTFLTATEYSALIGAPGGYNLTGGFSESQALVTHGGSGDSKMYESGTPFGFTFNVNVGGSGADPTWDGRFDLTCPDDGDTLGFDAAGTIGNDGHFSLGNLSNYQLVYGSDTYTDASITSADWDGQLLTDGVNPVTGAAGEYHFGHSDGTQIDGAWGTDLNP